MEKTLNNLMAPKFSYQISKEILSRFPLAEKLSVNITENIDEEKWNIRVCSIWAGALEQSHEYARLPSNWCGRQGFYITVSLADKIVGQALMIKQHSYLKNIAPKYLRWAVPLFDRLYDRVCRIAMGPLIFVPEFKSEIFAVIVEAAYKFSEKAFSYRLEIIPPLYDSDILFGDKETTLIFKSYEECLQEEGFEPIARATYLLNLQASLDNLWRNLGSDARTKVNRAIKDGITIRRCDTYDDFLKYYDVLNQTQARFGSKYHDFDLWKSNWESIRDYPQQGGIFVSESVDGDILSGQCMRLFNRVAVLSGVCYSELSRSQKLYGNDLMQWHMIQWAHSQNARLIDWSGASDESEKLKQVMKFKEKWGGSLVHYKTFIKTTPWDILRKAINFNARFFKSNQ